MNKVVYNDCFGGFNLSYDAIEWLYENTNDPDLESYIEDSLENTDRNLLGDVVAVWFDNNRHHRDLVAVVELLGSRASGSCSKLKIKTIQGNLYRIEEYDGYETVVTPQDEDWIIIK